RRVDLIQEGFDLAIRIARLDDSSLIARRLAPVRHGVYASPAYLAAHAAPSRAGELAGHACLVYSDSSEPGLWNYVGPDGTPGSIRVPARVTASSGDFLLRAALDGLGVILLPTFYVAEALRQGALVPVLADHAWPELSVYAVYPPTRHLSGRVRGFIDFLAERLAGEPYWDRA
ncbi:LysR family transcriptional regulator, partial [Parasulfuritortus cantonensis]